MLHQATLFNQVPPCEATILKTVDIQMRPLLEGEKLRRQLNFTPNLDPNAIACSFTKKRKLWILKTYTLDLDIKEGG